MENYKDMSAVILRTRFWGRDHAEAIPRKLIWNPRERILSGTNIVGVARDERVYGAEKAAGAALTVTESAQLEQAADMDTRSAWERPMVLIGV